MSRPPYEKRPTRSALVVVGAILAVSCLVAGCSSEDQLPPPVTGSPQITDTVAGGESDEVARVLDGGRDGSGDAHAADAAPSCRCAGCPVTLNPMVSVMLPCGTSVCERNLLRTCSATCTLSVSRC